MILRDFLQVLIVSHGGQKSYLTLQINEDDNNIASVVEYFRLSGIYRSHLSEMWCSWFLRLKAGEVRLPDTEPGNFKER